MKKTYAALAATAIAAASAGSWSALQDSPTPDPLLSDEVAVELCEEAESVASEYGPIESLLAAHSSTPAEFAAWESAPERGGQALPRADAGAATIALCYYEGTFAGFPSGPSVGGVALAPYGVLGLTIDSTGQTSLYVVSSDEDGANIEDAP